jgi:hypothetical protein
MKLAHTVKSKLKDNLRFRIVLILCCILFIVLRVPDLLLNPRLWAEEGVIFYAFALHHSLWDIFTTAHVGYLTLFNSIISALQAKVFSVENAVIISTYLGLLVQIIPVYIIVFTNNKFWDNPLKKIVCTLIVIVAMAPELYLNTTNSHFIFGLITFLIMIVSASQLSGMQKHLFRILLFVGGLTGPASIFLSPMFLLKAYRERSKEKYIQAGIISICAIIQAMVILYAILYNNTYHRLSNYNFGRTMFAFFGDNFSMFPHDYGSYANPTLFYVCLFLGILMSFFYLYLFIKNRRNNEYLIPLLSFILVAVFSTLGSLDMAGSPRYAYIPTCILLMVIVSEAFDGRLNKKIYTYITIAILMYSLVVNLYYYKSAMKSVYSTSFPKWKEEVAKWRADSTYNPKVHPADDRGLCVKL